MVDTVDRANGDLLTADGTVRVTPGPLSAPSPG
jgi:hypothetical protein